MTKGKGNSGSSIPRIGIYMVGGGSGRGGGMRQEMNMRISPKITSNIENAGVKRDTEDIGSIITGVEEYYANNSSIPDSALANYLKENGYEDASRRKVAKARAYLNIDLL